MEHCPWAKNLAGRTGPKLRLQGMDRGRLSWIPLRMITAL
jgi:hypothetical protein